MWYDDSGGQPEHHQCNKHMRRAIEASGHRDGKTAIVANELGPCTTHMDGHVPVHGPKVAQHQFSLQHQPEVAAGAEAHLSPSTVPAACQGSAPPGPWGWQGMQWLCHVCFCHGTEGPVKVRAMAGMVRGQHSWGGGVTGKETGDVMFASGYAGISGSSRGLGKVHKKRSGKNGCFPE